jgi:hypothetical protein
VVQTNVEIARDQLERRFMEELIIYLDYKIREGE